MKPLTYFRFALFIPYILWGISLLVILPISMSNVEISEAWNLILTPVAFFAIGVILWFFPYTILAIGLWVWSKNRSTAELRNMALISPLLFFLLLSLEAAMVNLPAESIMEFTKNLLQQSLLLGVVSLVFGYLCVGIALGTFKFLQAKRLIAEEELSLSGT